MQISSKDRSVVKKVAMQVTKMAISFSIVGLIPIRTSIADFDS